MTDLKPTNEQQRILDAMTNLPPVLVIEAGAGTGKTSTLKMIGRVLNGRGQYTAFNAALVAESKSKFSGLNVDCNTTHSLAFRAVGCKYEHRLGGNRIRAEEVSQRLGIEAMIVTCERPVAEGQKPLPPIAKRLAPGFLAGQVMGAIKRFCQSADREITGSHFKYIDGIDMPLPDGRSTYANNERIRDYLLPFARKAWKDLSSTEGTLPFQHDHYVKIWQLDKPVISADYILLDEAQDTAPVMLDVLKQQTCPIILVGDSCQAIYEWRGAVNALGAFEDAPRYFLSQSFRFGNAIADVANAVLAELEEPTELLLRGFDKVDSRVEAVANPTAILCRTNAVAVATLLSSMAEGKSAFMIGGGSDVTAFVRAAQELMSGRSTAHPDLACFNSWTEVQEYVKEDEGDDLKLMVKLIDEFSPESLLGALSKMPTNESDADIVICTAHKSKGREWDTVKLASDFPTKSKCNDASIKLLYVAATRAKMRLDVTECPFFTGQDSLDIHSIRDRYQSMVSENAPAIAPPAPIAKPSVAQFTWSSLDGKWLVRGPLGMAGKTVEVCRKDGSKQRKTLVTQFADIGNNTALYVV